MNVHLFRLQSTFLVFLSLMVAIPVLQAQPDIRPGAAQTENLVPALKFRPAEAPFLTSICRDRSGTLWIGSESNGIWQYDPQFSEWQPFTTQDGLGDDSIYALAVDKQNRVWAGHLNHGVSVWNGDGWKNYGPLEGAAGERVFAIAVSPLDGDVWIAHNAGLTRYSVGKKQWLQLPPDGDFPLHTITCLAFDPWGNLFAGTQTSGIGIAHPDEDFRQWHISRGPEKLPDVATGTGLPGNQINTLLSDNKTVWAGTTRGLARSEDGGDNWTFVRGVDWQDKLWGLEEFVRPRETAQAELLREDWITSLAPGPDNTLYIGFRRQGFELRDTQTNKVLSVSPTTPFISAMLHNGEAPLFVAYGESLLSSAPPNLKVLSAPVIAEWPTPQRPPTLEELNGTLKELSTVAPWNEKTSVAALPDDWTTQGSWIGRYGRYWACVGAILGAQDYIWGAGENNVAYAVRTGPRSKPNDSLRYYIQWLYSKESRVLEMPPVYFDSRLKMQNPPSLDEGRRQAEWNDNGHEYPPHIDGPSVFFSLQVPEGWHVMSLYDVNKDGHDGPNRMRDYRVSIRTHESEDMRNIEDFPRQPELASGRIREFWHGVWKRYLVRGPQRLTIQIDRNNSHNTMLGGVFLDRFEPKPPPYFQPLKLWKEQEIERESRIKVLLGAWNTPEHATRFAAQSSEKKAIEALWTELENLRGTNPIWWAQNSRPYFAALWRYYSARENMTPPDERETLYERMALCAQAMDQWQAAEKYFKAASITTAREIEKSLKWDGKSSYVRGYQTVVSYLYGEAAKPTP